MIVSNPNTSLSQAGNGVPVVNIAAPNASGLSHNQYQQYNVDSRGVILNNATGQTQSTQLGGIIIGNQNLKGRAASTILNEVNGANASQLNGYTEVAGQSARVIVANPYGISCNGCGFINTPQVTLTTGKPVLDSNGQLTRFNVQGGSVSIDGAGLNAGNVDQFDIITRSAKINAELHANKLNIITGRNDVDANTLNATALADDGSAKPELAIDSSALGGMYAGTVRLVGTEAGVGVKLAGNLAASAGDIQIDANGKLTVGQAAASGAITVKANGVEVNGPAYAGTSTSISSSGDLAVRQNIAARDAVNLSASGQLTNAAIIEAGVNADNSRNATGDVVLSANSLSNTGSVTASRNLQATVTQTLTNQNATLSGQASTRITAGTLDNRQSGRILSQSGTVDLNADQVLNEKGVIASAGNLTVKAGTLDNRNKGAVSAQRDARLDVGQLINTGGGNVSTVSSLSITASGAVNNQGGALASDAALTLSSSSLDNSQTGRIVGNNVTVTTGAFNNQQSGQLSSTGALALKAGQVNNGSAGKIASAGALTAVVTGLDQTDGGRVYGKGDVSLDLSRGVLNNQGGLIAAPGQLLLKNLATVNNRGGEISSASGFSLAATLLDNTDGSVISDKALVVKVDQMLTNLRGLISANGIDLTANELNNTSGNVSSDADLLVSTTNALNNRLGELTGAGTTTLTAMSLSNAGGQIMADHFLNLVVTNAVDNQAGTLGAGLGVDVKATSLDNRAGTLVTDGDAKLVLSGALDNRTGGALQAKGRVDIASLSLNNQGGSIRAQTGMLLRVDSLDNSQVGLTGAAKGLIYSNAGLEVTGKQLDNRSGLINSKDLLQVTAATVLNDQGRIASQAGLTAKVDNLTQQGGELVAQGDLTLTGKTLDNRANGLVGSTQAVTLDVDDINNRGGEISSQSGLKITGQELDNSNGGKILAGTALDLGVTRVINHNKGLLFGDTVKLTGTSLDNTGGSVAGQKDLNLDLSGALENGAGLLSSEGTLTVKADTLSNVKGSVSSAGALQATTAAALNNQQGSITTDAGLVLVSGSLDNSNKGSLSGKGATRVETGLFDNSQGGRLTSSDTLLLTAGKVINQGAGRIASALALTASVTSLDQQGGELFSNTSVSLDLNHGQLNNQGGLINAPGALLLKNLKGVDNQNGEISSDQSFDLVAESLDNSDGKLLSNQTLTLVVDKALRNLKGTISAASLSAASDSLDNGEGLINSRGALDLAVDTALTNINGTVIADGDLQLNAATANNAKGQIASKQNLIARVDSFEQLAGELVAQGSLSLTGDKLVNGEDGFVGATQGLNLIVAKVDNRGGEISSQGTITLTGQQLNNSDGGRVLAQQALTLGMTDITNRAGVLLSSKAGLTLTGASLDNIGGTLSALQGLTVDLSGALDNSKGVISSEELLKIEAGSLANAAGSVSSADDLTLDVVGAISNDGGALVTDGALDLDSASLTNRQSGNISGKALLTLTTGDFDNSQKGRVSGGDRLELTAAKLTNRDQGSIGSSKALLASVTSLDQQGGRLFSNTSLSLDLNNGELNNQGGLINAPGTLLLKNLGTVLNQNGEISSAEAFTLTAQTLDNSNGKLLSNQDLTLRIAQALNSVKGTIAAAGVDIEAGTLNNSGGTLISRNDLDLTVTGLVNNRDQGLINSAGTLDITAASLDAGNGGEVSALGDMTLALNALSLDAGRLIGDAAVSIDLNSGDLSNQAGLITAKGPLTLNRLRDLSNQSGEISSEQSFLLSGRTLNNSSGKIISSNLLTLNGTTLTNQTGLLSGWQGVTVTGGSLDNRNTGTVSSRNGNVGVNLSGALLNGNAGALVSQQALTVTANSLDNTGGILSSGAGQTLTVSGLLNNSQNGLIDSGAGLAVKADTLQNVAGNIAAQQDVNVEARELNNTSGNLSSKGGMTLDLLGQLLNTQGKLASGGAMLLRRSTQISNQGGQLVSQNLMTLNTGSLDNSNRGTVAANDSLVLNATGKVFNNADGLIYSQNADLQLTAAGLDNARGAVQSQTGLNIDTTGDIDNQSGRLIAQTGALDVEAANLDSRGGVLSSLQGAFTATVTGVLRNGYDLTNQGGVIQAQRLNLSALGGFDNNGGRISARTGEALITTANFDNRGGGLYGKGLLRVIARDFDNSSNGQIAAGQIDLRLSGALNNQTGIVESDSTLAVTATQVNNQNGRLRALGTGGKTDFQIGSLFDNRNGALDVANSDLTLNTPSFLNSGGSLLHTGSGSFDISTGNITNAGGSLVTQGGLTLTADSWTNNSVIQAGRLTVNVGTFHQTASGQLLASSAFTGTGGEWINDGLIASDGSFDMRLRGAYSGNGRASSMGSLNLNAGQITLNASGAVTGGARTELSLTGNLSNFGRITSAASLSLNAGAINNYGTLGAAQELSLLTASVLNREGLIFGGSDVNIHTDNLVNRNGDLYGLRNITVKGFGADRATQVSNISGSMESGGSFSISAADFQNRTDGSEAGQGFGVGRTLVKGLIALQCLDCRGDHYAVNFVVKEFFEGGQDSDTTASALLTAGKNLTFDGGTFLNSKSIVSATGNIEIKAENFKNLGAVGGSMERTRTFVADGVTDGTIYRSLPSIDAYNQRNNPDYPNVYYIGSAGDLRLGIIVSQISVGGYDTTYQYNEYFIRDSITKAYVENTLIQYDPERPLPASSYDASNLLELPTEVTRYAVVSDVEVATDGSVNGGRSAVIQAGGNVSITAKQDLQNSVIYQDYTGSAGTSKVQDTRTSATGTTVVRINAQLPPDLAQQQVNPLALPGFSLPTGKNGLFRLSSDTAKNTSMADTAPQGWSLGSAAVSVAQREHVVPAAQAGTIELGSIGQISGASRQLALIARQNAGVSASASPFDVSLPTGTPLGGAVVPGHGSDAASFEGTDAVTSVTTTRQASGTLLPVQNGGSSGALPLLVPGPSSGSTAQNGGAAPNSPILIPGSQTVERVQGLPSSGVVSKPQKYLIETNPVLTELKQFMSSDYLLSKLGYDPDASAKRLGDGLYEQRLVQQAVVARTGQAFLSGQASNEDQFRYLMNNAVASKDELNLAVGVSLTSQQVAALTHDIVWLEEHEVNGETVLVPVLYLAQADNRLGPTGALIAGNDVSLIAGQNLDNVGTLRATNSLTAAAGKDLINTGLIQAGNRLDLLAGNDLINKAGGIITGRDVTMTAINGDVINERSITSMDNDARGKRHNEFADSAARIEAANDVSISAGRDFNNQGSVLQSGRDISIVAGRDVTIAPTQVNNSLFASTRSNSSDITLLGSTVTAGRDMTLESGRDISIIASQIDAKRDIAMAANENLTISSAADEYHSLSKSKKLTVQKDNVHQVSTEMEAGGNISLVASQNLAVISSRITAGNEAYLVAGDNLDILAAQDSDYSLYDKKKKGSWGKKVTKRDEVTDVRNVSSEIKAGGDLLLVSGGDQHYQVAKLQSGNDLTIDSGGAVTFEGVKDLHQESHEKSKSDLSWNSMKGKGSTNETLRQSELVAKGDLAIHALDGLKIDVKQVSQQTVSQAIDAMVKADPQLAWLKEAEKRGDVDWRMVQEIHQSFKYSHSGLGAGAQLVLAIALAAVTGGAGAAAVGASAGSFAAGFANAVLISLEVTAVNSAISNKGNLGAVAKDTFSKESLQGAVVSGLTAGFINYASSSWFGATADGVPGKITGPSIVPSLLDPAALARFSAIQFAGGAVNGVLSEATGQGSFKDSMLGSVFNVLQATAFNGAGDLSDYFKLPEGEAGKIAVHAVVGGLLSEVMGGDFKTGALAAGANEALIDYLSQSDLLKTSDPNEHDRMVNAASKLVGLFTAAATGGNISVASEITGNAQAYNRKLHTFEQEIIGKEAQKLEQEGKSNSGISWEGLLSLKAGAEIDAADEAKLDAILGMANDRNPEKINLKADLARAEAVVTRLQSEKIQLSWADGTPIIADGAQVYAFSATSEQKADATLFNPKYHAQPSGDGAPAIPTEWVKQFGPAVAYQNQSEIGSLGATNLLTQEWYQQISAMVGGGIVPIFTEEDVLLAIAGGLGAKGALAVIADKRAAKLAADEAEDLLASSGATGNTKAPQPPRFIADSSGNTIDLEYTKALSETHVTITGARGGVQYPLQDQAPNSYANLGNGHVVVYGPEGRALYDVSSSRIKVVEWNQAPDGKYFPKKGSDTKAFVGKVPQSVLDSLGLKL
ncbi:MULTISPECIES: two-partner secretion domain-containing protein [unclassified Pseudomonas]|uniref:two-partner secretion domain-containing protein n=1 Tax=Pseudomonas sp. R1-18 TaxID=1632772 RepID=UPI003DAA232B